MMVQETTWGAGSHRRDDHVIYLTPEEIEQGLIEIDKHVSDEAWLWNNEDRNFEVLKWAIYKDAFYHRGVNLLCDIASLMLLAADPSRWRDLLMDGLVGALSINDDMLLADLFT